MQDPRNFPPIPNGWFAVAASSDVARGAVVPLRAFGRDLVLFRAEKGRAEQGGAAVLDRYCAHLGASLAHGGKVRGDSIECPFHHWRFDGSGQCLSVPQADRIPPNARVGSWPTAEANGLIHVYHHAERAAPPGPPPSFDALADARFVRVGGSTFSLDSHPQEVSENAFDPAHFPAVHRTTYPDIEAKQDGDIFRVRFTTQPMLDMRVLPLVSNIDIQCVGLGLTIVNVRIAPLVDVFVFSYAMPVERDKVTMRHLWLADGGRGLTRPVRLALGWIAGQEAIRQARQDRVIWDHKIHRPQPVLAHGDRTIGLFRRWVRRFYSAPAEMGAAHVGQG